MKGKRRNSEKRKEKSRDAARCRRSKESEVFFELANSLPLPASVTSQLDKASVMRVAISFLKICKVLDQHSWAEPEKGKGKGKISADQLFPKALDGFVFILSREGDIIYVNESVIKYLGIQQIELIGQSIFEFSHPRDEDEIRDALADRPQGSRVPITEERMFFLRMKCTLTSKGRNVNLKSASYKVIKCTGRLVKKNGRRTAGGVGTFSPYLLAIGEPIPHPANIEIPMDNNTFLSKHDMDMTFTYCDERVKDLVNYNSDELIGQSLYDYHHALDSNVVEKAYKDMLSKGKGQTMTGQYRFLARDGGYAWVVTQATVIYNNRNHKAQWVVCVHYVLSHVEHTDLVLSEVQLPLPTTKSLPGAMQLSTESIFSQKTDDMDKSYFIPPEIRETINMINNEPEDLSYLAPMAGDECVPLSFPSFSQFSSKDDDRTLSSPPGLLSMGGMKKEPGMFPALCRTKGATPTSTLSPCSSSSNSVAASRMSSPLDYQYKASPRMVSQMDQFFQALNTQADGGQGSREDESDYTKLAPYIDMTGDDDVSLMGPSSESLLIMQNEVDPGLFGKTEHVFTPKTEDLFEEHPTHIKLSVRDMLGGSTTVASIEQPPDIMFQQLKRPLDMNSLEKGPPAVKMQRFGQLHDTPAPSSRLHDTPAPSSCSVLLNLLMRGEDPNGYKVMSPNLGMNKQHSPRLASMRPQLLTLTQRDCEVNAPTPSGGLLHGADLLRALEIDIPPTPR